MNIKVERKSVRDDNDPHKVTYNKFFHTRIVLYIVSFVSNIKPT